MKVLRGFVSDTLVNHTQVWYVVELGDRGQEVSGHKSNQDTLRVRVFVGRDRYKIV